MCLAFLAAADAARADTVTLNPAQDTFISEQFSGPNGVGFDMVIGTQGMTVFFKKNRGLIQFDLSSIPVGAVVNSVALRLMATAAPRATNNNSNFNLHRVLRPWNALESTWVLRLEPDENWEFPGGQAGTDFAETASSSAFISSEGSYTFASMPGLVADVSAWLANPPANHGWLVKTEDESVGFTARRFASREAPGAPVLEVQFDLPPPALRIDSAAIVAGDFCARFSTKAGKTYTLERRERVDTGDWTVVATRPPVDADGEATLCDPVAAEGNRFYRVGER